MNWSEIVVYNMLSTFWLLSKFLYYFFSLLGYTLKVKLIITFVTNQIINLSGNISNCQGKWVNKDTQMKHEAKATKKFGSKNVMNQFNCDMTTSKNKST